MSKKARIYLEDGTILEGESFGHESIAAGEIVFTTAMNGYPESLTDPSYKGQILVMTHPLVGNYGVPKKRTSDGILDNFESEHITVEGLVVSEVTGGSKWNKDKSLSDWLKAERIIGISGIDTRKLTKRIRVNGAMNGVIAGAEETVDVKKRLNRKYESRNLVELVSPKKPVFHDAGRSKKTIVIVDFGVKHGILSCMHDIGYNMVRVPHDYSAKKIMSFDPDGILYSNGPGNPHILKEQIKEFKEVVSYRIPTLGLCLGHQVAVLALGGRMRKMKFGHRGINKPVLDVITKNAYITTHNHGYAAYESDLPDELEEWFVSIDDKVVEGTMCAKYNLITTQFHPEARPGTKDTRFVFKIFDKMIKDAGK